MSGPAIVVNGRFLAQETTGVQRFAREVCRAAAGRWPAPGGGGRIPILHPAGAPPRDAGPVCGDLFAPTPLGRLRGHSWEQLELGRSHPDALLLNLTGSAPAWRRRQLVVLHDAAVAANPRAFSRAFRTWYRIMIAGYVRAARHLVTVSRFSAGEIARHFGVPYARLHVVPASGGHVLREPPDRAVLEVHGLEPDSYVLAVSSHSPNKNFRLVLEAMRLLRGGRMRFVIAGGGSARVFGKAPELGPEAVTTGYVSDAQLRALYEHAACFVFPSLYEGFGLPPLEAMACGCPTIVSRTSSLPEVCGDAALYCDPHSPADLAAGLRRLWSDPALRAELRARGRERAARYRWTDCADAVWAIASS
ncbi:MAG TPA: glycosyltransferase family 1 protein [Gemmatimonadales bacterium]|nr:glycosyltransferase family 1 protein [Gemmatimonadales bacterium]